MSLSPADEAALAEAVRALENTNLAARVADYAGEPVDKALRLLPGMASRRVQKAVEGSVLKALDFAIKTLDHSSAAPPAIRRSTLIAGVTGGVAGLAGLLALPIELPITTVFMLRAIADIARHEGEDLSRIEARLACVEVFALASQGGRTRMDIGYYASRALLTKLTQEAATFLMERGITSAAAPAIGALVSAIATRFGLVVSDRLALSALPVIGAAGGATINVIFMNHFQRVAQGHFTVRRLERRHGVETVQRRYDALARDLARARATRPLLPRFKAAAKPA